MNEHVTDKHREAVRHILGLCDGWTKRCDDAKRIPDMLAEMLPEILARFFPVVPASRDENRELAIQLIDNWIWNIEQGTETTSLGGHRVGLMRIRDALTSPPLSTPDERSV